MFLRARWAALFDARFDYRKSISNCGWLGQTEQDFLAESVAEDLQSPTRFDLSHRRQHHIKRKQVRPRRTVDADRGMAPVAYSVALRAQRASGISSMGRFAGLR